MSDSITLPLFHLSPFDDVRSPLYQPRALATVEHEGTTWLLRPFRNLLFFKRADDENGDSIFVLTEPLLKVRPKPSQEERYPANSPLSTYLKSKPKPKPAQQEKYRRHGIIATRFEGETNSAEVVQLWKQYFPDGKWARFGVSQWEGGWDAQYDRDPTQFDLCFLFSSKRSIRVTTDMSLQGRWIDYADEDEQLPEYVSPVDRCSLRHGFIDLAIPKDDSGKSLPELLLTAPVGEFVEEFFTDLQRGGYSEWNRDEDEDEEEDEERNEEREFQYPKKSDIVLENAFPLKTELTFCGGSREELETLIRYACYIQPLLTTDGSEEKTSIIMEICSTSIFDQARIQSVRSEKTAWSRPDNGRFDFFKEFERRDVNVTLPPTSFIALCQIILDHIEPVGDSFEMDHESCFRCFTSRNFVVEFPPPSSHDIIEASARLREWLQGKTSHKRIEELLIPTSSTNSNFADKEVLEYHRKIRNVVVASEN